MYNEKKIEMIKKSYPAGTRICLDSMDNDPNPIAPGTMGTVLTVDDMGQLVMKWDNGRGLSLIPGEDRFHVVKQELDEPELDTAENKEAKMGMEMSM